MPPRGAGQAPEAEGAPLFTPPAAIAVFLGVVAFAVLLTVTDGLTFFADEWNVILREPGWSADSLFEPLNEHIYAGPVVIYKVLLEIFGMDQPWAFRAMNLILLITVCALVFAWVRQRLGDFVAVVILALLLFLGPAWEDLLWGAGISFLGALAGGLGALLAIDRNTARSDVAACALLAAALAFSTLGLIFAVGVAVDIILRGDRRIARLYVVAVPVLLYLAWYAAYGHEAQSNATLDNFYDVPRYIWLSMASAIASLLGLTGIDADSLGVNPQFGIPVLVLGVVAVLWLAFRRPEVLSRRFWAVAASAFSFWALAGLNEVVGREPGASRYQLIGAVFIVLMASELLRGRRLEAGGRWVLGGLAALALLSNLGALRQGEHFFRAQSESTLASLAALEGARGAADPGFLITFTTPGNPFRSAHTVGTYYEAVDRWGSPSGDAPDPAEQPEPARAGADQLLSSVYGLTLESGSSKTAFDCTEVEPDPGTDAATVDLPAGGAEFILSGPTSVRLRRWSEGDFPVDLGPAQGASAALAIPVDEFDRSWTAELTAPGPTQVCPLNDG